MPAYFGTKQYKPAFFLAVIAVMCYLIGQISNLTLEPLDLPPQVFFFLVHSFPVASLFSEIFFKDLHLL